MASFTIQNLPDETHRALPASPLRMVAALRLKLGIFSNVLFEPMSGLNSAHY